ncbi:alkaline phosphatase family protein [Mycolicibacterium sp.]|uniref:alkaline phosphatase family protein n=1 Tax=Mycolicibacterium sp. TaxID=2320850 RepID=UPI0025FB204D|nr:alkaline phosphatase family protein [Mycolicibacterium sp.]MCB9410596.1 hypothetical protein [Mycolicibacterium sp.]
MNSIKQVCLGVAVAGALAGGGATAVAHAEPSTSPSTDSATSSSSPSRGTAGPTRTRARVAKPAAAAPGSSSVRDGASTATAPKSTRGSRGTGRNRTAADDITVPVTAPETSQGSVTAPQVPAPAVEVVDSIPAEAPVQPAAATLAETETSVPENISVAPVSDTVSPAPADPAPQPLPVPVLPVLPVLPALPASAVSVSSTTGTGSRVRAASAVAQAEMLADPPVGLASLTAGTGLSAIVEGVVTAITDQLQAIVDQNIFVVSELAGAAKAVVQLVGDGLVAAAQAIDRVIAYVTGSDVILPTEASLTAAVATQSENLLANPGAEIGDPSPTGNSAVSIPGWTLTGTPMVMEYGTPRNSWPLGTSFPFPDLPSFMSFPKPGSGPADGGTQFFGGGNVGDATLTQTVDLSAAGAEIDLGGVSYNLSGWLGGWLYNPSQASVKVSFLDANKTYLGETSIAPVGVFERLFQTGLKEHATSGELPQGTRFAEVVVDLDQRALIDIGINQAYNSAFADNISFTIGADLPAPPDPTPPVSAVGELDHVFMVYMENKGYDDILGSPNAPFINSLINAYGFADNYYGLTHGSLPNYYAIVGGSTFVTYNCATACIDVPTTLASNIDDAGKTWRSYAQGLQPGADPLEETADYGAADEVAFLAFSSITSDQAYVEEHIKPLEQMAVDLADPATAPDFVWFGPNEDNNGEGPVDFPWGMLRFAISQISPGHQYNVPALDNFLAETVPVVLNSETFKTTKSVLVVTFDEDNNNTSLGFGNEGNHIVTVVIPSPMAVSEGGMRGGAFVATDHYNHYSLLSMINSALGLPNLTNNDLYAAPMNEFWTAGVTGGAGTLV